MSDKRVKQFASTIKADGPRTFTFTISTAGVDSEKDTVAVEGWDLTRYRANPVVLWAHNYHEPQVAKCTAIRVASGKLVASIVFPEPEPYPSADEIRGLIEQGFISATSVGFRPIKWRRNEERGGIDFSQQELLEFSIVPIPANPECLIDPRAAKSYDKGRLSKFLGITLDGDEQINLDDLDVGLVSDSIDVSPEDVRRAVRAYVDAAVTRAVPGATVLQLDDDDIAISADDIRAAVRETMGTVVTEHVDRAIRIARGRID